MSKRINQIVCMIAAVLLFTISSCTAQKIANKKTETVNVYGNCGSCKKNIETAAYKKKTSSAVWDKDAKTAMLTYDSTKTTADAILKNIALAGYDNQNYMAPNNAYSSLDMCCQYDRKKSSQQMNTPGGDAGMHTNHDMHNMSNTQTQPDTTKKMVVATNPLTPVYTAYFGLKNALTKDDGTTAAAKAKELSSAVDAVDMTKLTTEQHTAWMKYMSQLKADADKISSGKKIDAQRNSFATLSNNIHEVLKAIKSDTDVYYNYCPMKDAYWLSDIKGIQNPFFGSQMFTCGSTKETISK